MFSTDGSATGKQKFCITTLLIVCTIGEDYNSGTFIVKFNATTTRAPFSVAIKEDELCEGNENFTLFINPSSLPNKVTVTSPGQATVTIVDNESKQTLW